MRLCRCRDQGPVVTFRSPGSHPRGRDEEGGSDKRTSVTEGQQDKEPDPDLRPSSRFRPPPLSRPPRVFVLCERVHPIFFSRDIETLSSLSLSFQGTTRRVSSSLYRDSRSLLGARLSDPGTATWTLVRQLVSVLMVLIDRILSRVHCIHHREEYARHM